MTIPNTMLNWYNATSKPLFFAGAISEIYMGATTEEAPTPNPPRNLNKVNEVTSQAKPDPTAEIK